MELTPITHIKTNPDNPRLIKDEKFAKLVKSIKDFPEMLELRPIVVNEQMVVLGGNMRLKACKEAGLTEVPIIKASSLTPEQQKEFIIKDNVGFGEWDWDTIANEWDAEKVTEWGLDIPGFVVEPEATEDDYEIPDEITTDIVLGDLFEIGEHRLLCGDSTQTDTFKALFGQQMADLVITDPPYNVALGANETIVVKKRRNRRTDGLEIKNDHMDDDSFYKFLYDFYTALGSYTKAGGAWYVWHSSSEALNFLKSFKDSGLKLSSIIIWNKNSMIMGRQDYQWKHEPCIYGWKEGAAHGWYSDRKQTTVLDFDRPQKSKEHPTMKPVTLFSYQIGNSSRQGDIVADGFGGSGTTMVACHQMGRKAYLVEFDPKYCQVIVDRMRKLDPDIEIKRNGVKYEKTVIEQ